MKKILFLLFTGLATITVYAQTGIQWQMTYGHLGQDGAFDIHQTADGGYIVFGNYLPLVPNDTTVPHSLAKSIIWVLKLNPTGQIQWQKEYGGPEDELSGNIIQTDDSGYIFAGTSFSNSGGVTGHHGSTIYPDAWVVKIDSLGNIQWQQSYGNTWWDIGKCIQKAANGGYYLFAQAEINGGQVSGNHGEGDLWLLKLSDTGSIEWQKCFGGSKEEKVTANASIVTTDGGCLLSCITYSNDGDVTGQHGGGPPDLWLAKISATGTLDWEKALGGTGSDYASSVKETSDHGFIIAGGSNSEDGDVSGLHENEYYLGDVWIVRLDSSGVIQWQKMLGGTGYEFGGNIQPTSDGGYFVTGLSASVDGDLNGITPPGPGSVDSWMFKLNSTGDIIWQKRMGGSEYDSATILESTSDGSYILAGSTSSTDGDVVGATGFYTDYWVVKLTADLLDIYGAPGPNPTGHMDLFPNPVQSTIHLIIAGETASFTANIFDSAGRQINSKTIETDAFLDVSMLPDGMYFVEVIGASGKVYSGKFSKQQ